MIVLYVICRGVLVFVALVGWLIGIIMGTFISSMVAGFKRGFEG